MKTLILIVLCWLPVLAFSQEQGMLTVFSTEGDPFYLYVDGLRQNEIPGKEVKVSGITRLYCQVKVEFTDAAHTSVTRNRLSVSDGEDNLMNATYRVIRQGNTARLRFYSMSVPGVIQPLETAKKQSANTTADNQPAAALTVFSDQGDNFFLYINGVQQNTVAQSRIRVEGLPDLFYQVKMVFADPKLPAYTRNNLSVSDGDDQLMDTEYKLSRSGNASRLKFYAMRPSTLHPVIQAGTYVYHFGQSGLVASVKPEVTKTVEPKPADNVKETETTLYKEPKPVIKTVPEKKQPSESPKQAAQPTASNQQATPKAAEVKKIAPPPAAAPVKQENRSTTLEEPVNWVCANEWPIWKTEYANAKKKIESSKSDEERLTVTKQLLSSNCFNTDQVIELARLFTREDSRLNFVKDAFSRTIDYKNYLKVMSVFQTEAAKSTLSSFLYQLR